MFVFWSARRNFYMEFSCNKSKIFIERDFLLLFLETLYCLTLSMIYIFQWSLYSDRRYCFASLSTDFNFYSFQQYLRGPQFPNMLTIWKEKLSLGWSKTKNFFCIFKAPSSIQNHIILKCFGGFFISMFDCCPPWHDSVHRILNSVSFGNGYTVNVNVT